MLTYDMGNCGACSMYDYLYRCIRGDIEAGAIAAGEKLPSKRALAKHLGVSVITVEAAYAQLIAEGYVRAQERRGYFAEPLPTLTRACSGISASAGFALGTRVRPANTAQPASAARPANVVLPTSIVQSADIAHPSASAADLSCPSLLADFTSGAVASGLFPFSAWAKAVRETLSYESESTLLSETPAMGLSRLRQVIAGHLHGFRGMAVDPDCIVVGAGAQVLYNMVVQLLGRNLPVAVEDPGYVRLASIYRANDVPVAHVPLDTGGISMSGLRASSSSVAHIMPSHQFPTGLVTSAARRYELLEWAVEASGRYLVEDDYDCEFRFSGRPIPALQSIDANERVIYTNTFAKSLGPAFRIGYLVLPRHLAQKFVNELGFYSCTVSAVDQLALARFMESGNFERHVNRMRVHYRSVKSQLIASLKSSEFGKRLGSRLRFEAVEGGLHFVMAIDGVGEAVFTQAARRTGVALAPLSGFYADAKAEAEAEASGSARFVMSYGSLDSASIPDVSCALAQALKNTHGSMPARSSTGYRSGTSTLSTKRMSSCCVCTSSLR